ncbi:hypothetical protein AB0W32_23095, partial [Escherichia coli]|uniref:hypothetical protein n=2 Tax=Escherichia coli TaxID=562 RepID=UPI002235A6F5
LRRVGRRMQSLPLNASLNDLADREEPSMRKSFVTCRAIPIYHNVTLRAPLKRAERDSAANTAKRDAFPGVNRKNASGSLSAHCIAMHESEWRSVWELTAFIPSVFDSFSPGS